MGLAGSTPAAQGVTAEGVHAFLDAMEGEPNVEPHSLVILRHGYEVAAGWWSPYTFPRPHLLYSLSKTFVGTAVGLAVADGLLRLDDPVVNYFPEFRQKVTGRHAQSMLVRHLASMASGHSQDTTSRVFNNGPEDPVLSFLLVPPEHEPGTVFAYNQPATYTLAAIVQRVTGETLTRYLRRRVLDKLGADEVSWLQSPAGRDIGYSGLYATTRTVALLGQLYLQGGQWQGEQLLPRSWVADATQAQVPTRKGKPDWDVLPTGESTDGSRGYGYQVWVSRHGYRGDGAYGQFCLVLPEQDAVVAMTGQTHSPGRPDMQTVLIAVWDYLVPAFRPGPVAETVAGTQLRERLESLALPTIHLDAGPGGDEDVGTGARFSPEGGRCAEQPSLQGIEVQPDEVGWQVTLCEAGAELRAHFLPNAWAVTESEAADNNVVPLAGNGGWLNSSTLRFDAIFLETPHRLCLTCDVPSKTFMAAWVTRPGHISRLADLHAGPLVVS